MEQDISLLKPTRFEDVANDHNRSESHDQAFLCVGCKPHPKGNQSGQFTNFSPGGSNKISLDMTISYSSLVFTSKVNFILYSKYMILFPNNCSGLLVLTTFEAIVPP